MVTSFSLRRRILAVVGTLGIAALLASTLSLYRITEMNRSLRDINRFAVPVGTIVSQLRSDAELLNRELDRRLGRVHWADPHWRAQPPPPWLLDLVEGALLRLGEVVEGHPQPGNWLAWSKAGTDLFRRVKAEGVSLAAVLKENRSGVLQQELDHAWARWSKLLEEWNRHVREGFESSRQLSQEAFRAAERQASDLRMGLRGVLLAILVLSLMLLWLGERALRPLARLTLLAHEISNRGLRKCDKESLSEIPVSRLDEVGQLAREFHNMATALLEREKTVETQNARLADQNRLLHEALALNRGVLNTMSSMLFVIDFAADRPGSDVVITRCNPSALRWLGLQESAVIGHEMGSIPGLRGFHSLVSSIDAGQSERRFAPVEVNGRWIMGYWKSMRPDNGAILVLDDCTERLEMEKRLRSAEHLAAIGRMSAQVAHEVRNPLHSIGLEAELAMDVSKKTSNPELKQALASILQGVDRLEKITENYLKFSRLSVGDRAVIDLGEVLEKVLAAYGTSCEAARVKVDWRKGQGFRFPVLGDASLLEQGLGNLQRNSIQAIEGSANRVILWTLDTLESGRQLIRIEDSGPGISPAIRESLFIPFVTTRADGTGLGLPFVKKVVEDHGGEIRVVPSLELGGACFEIVLPAADEHHEQLGEKKNAFHLVS